jgi:hypothetical protein
VTIRAADVDGDGLQTILANFAGQVPEAFTFLRLTKISTTVSYGPFGLRALGVLDILGCAVSADCTMFVNGNTLEAVSPSAAIPLLLTRKELV